ncbi:lysine-specific demethylase 2A-like [Polyodon spathula]|uniref:lysine-specific demethylase 2A-like n=1 Tax=Polyodon spathula TaxID=7913 RepID=UPI001B7DF756|nr:lysine-specific demethylase 2A-like [Polyodon spathula]
MRRANSERRPPTSGTPGIKIGRRSNRARAQPIGFRFFARSPGSVLIGPFGASPAHSRFLVSEVGGGNETASPAILTNRRSGKPLSGVAVCAAIGWERRGRRVPGACDGWKMAESKLLVKAGLDHTAVQRESQNTVSNVQSIIVIPLLQRSGTRRRYQDDGISDDEIEGKRTFDLEEKLISSNYNANFIKVMEGKDLDFEYIQREGLRDPLIFMKPDGLGIKMPGSDFGVNDVKHFVGSRRMIDVMDVSTQKGIEMSMSQWRRYYETPPEDREKLYNVISLEFSHTRLENLVQRPASVDLIDWVDNMWPRHLKDRQRDSTNAIFGMKYPKVQKYCLMSVKGCYTDFHIDFGGTSVWYHVHKGGKVFWVIPPTPQNLELYENWVLSGKQGDIFLGDKVSECQRIELKQGYTFMIPSGWIHAVYTPEDTLVFGGNFLHSFNIPMQLHIYNIEDRTRVPAKFRYPFYYEMCWYVLERYLYSLTSKSYLTKEFQRESLGIGLESEMNGAIKKEEEEKEEWGGSGNKNGGDDGESARALSRPPGEGGGGEAGGEKGGGKARAQLTPFELEGLWNLLGKLESLPPHKKCIPAGIEDPQSLLSDLKDLLEQQSGCDPELSYTGVPIVKWPKRPPSLLPPASVGRPRLYPSSQQAGGRAPRQGPRGVVSASLRRRRVRCKKCAACLRRECGSCNYCRDMKKNGGPGRMKQSCMLRQCLSPGLPLSSVCVVCEEGSQDLDDTRDVSRVLMECSDCSEIAHPGCIKVPGEGVLNKDLPNCWRCPKCCLEEADSQSESSECSTASAGSLSLSPASQVSSLPERRQLRGAGICAPNPRSASRAPRSPACAPPHTQRQRRHTQAAQRYKDCLQQQQRKRRLQSNHAAALELRLRKRIKLEREKILLQAKRKSVDGSVAQSKMKILRSLRSREDSAGGAGPGGRTRIPQGSASSVSTRSGQGVTTRSSQGAGAGPGGGARRRRGSAATGAPRRSSREGVERSENLSLRGARFRRRQHQHQHQQISRPRRSRVTSPSSSSSSTSSKRQGKENRPGLRRGSPSPLAGDPQSEGEVEAREGLTLAASTESEEEEQLARIKGSFLTVTLQRAPKAPSNGSPLSPSPSSSIVPRLQAIAQRSPRARPRPQCNGEPPRTAGGAVDRDPGMQKEVWMSVFRLLSRRELCDCMLVCKAWHRWGCDKKLWMKIDLSRCRSISPQALSGIIKRQPVTLDLSWTHISKKQLTWLINRLPGLKDLILAGCTWSSVSALSSSSCPLLRTLDLRWAEGVKDSQIRDLLSPPGPDNHSKLRSMVSFRLAGLELTDATLRLIIRHMPLLARLDISHCSQVTDQSINLLTAVGSSTRTSLTDINLAGCHKLTDACLGFLKRIPHISTIDLRGCKGISRKGCETLTADLNLRAPYCLSEDNFIQRLS